MKKFEATFERILSACGAISALLVAAVTMLVIANVLLRNAFKAYIPGDVELSEYAMLFLTAFVSPWLLHRGQHVRIDLMLQQVPAIIGWCCEIFADILGIAISLLMARYGIVVLIASINAGTKIPKVFIIPEWWTLWPLPMMFILLSVEFCFRLKRLVAGPRHPRNEGAPG